ILALVFFLPLGLWIKRIVGGFIILFFVLSMLMPVGDWAMAPLERCAAGAALPDSIDGAIVLGGILEDEATLATNRPQFNGAVGRFFALVSIAKAYPDATLVYTGGPDSPQFPDFHEADYIKQFLDDIGLHPAHLIIENQAKNTYQNALLTKQFFGRAPGQNWLIVTSAYHLPRAMGLFRQVGQESHTVFYPYPADFKTPGQMRFTFNFNLPGNIGKLDAAAKEYVGMAVNKFLGRSQHFMACGEEREKLL
nr:YdcF family protein [Alphaproteobacteria bacterium]